MNALAATVQAVLDEASELALEVVVENQPTELASLMRGVRSVRCKPEEFTSRAKLLSPEQAQVLLTTTLHRTMAYSSLVMPLERARNLASQLVGAVGNGAQFWSNCVAHCEISGVGSWYMSVTGSTFESVLYGIGQRQAFLLVAVDED